MKYDKWNSPANEFVTAIGSGQLSLTGEETSFFISAIKKHKTFFPLFVKQHMARLDANEKFQILGLISRGEPGKN